jgi:VanZ family protein
MAFIFALSSIAQTPPMPSGTDKLAHTLLYAGLGALLARALSGGARRVTLAMVAASLCIGTLYGITDEFHQYLNPPRNVEAYDVLADAIGSALGSGAFWAWGIIRGRDGL